MWECILRHLIDTKDRKVFCLVILVIRIRLPGCYDVLKGMFADHTKLTELPGDASDKYSEYCLLRARVLHMHLSVITATYLFV